MNTRLPKAFFSPAEIGEYIGLSTYKVQELCRKGELRHVRQGTRIRIKKEWIDELMANGERAPLPFSPRKLWP